MKKFVVTNYTIQSEKVSVGTKEITFVMLSDLHNVSIGENNEVLLRAIYKIQPDFILIGGDMLVGKPDHVYYVTLKLIQTLAKKFPIYYANGNHEYRMKIYPDRYKDMWERYSKQLKDAGVLLLANTSQCIDIRNTKLCIYGMEIEASYYSKKKKKELTLSIMNDWIDRPKEEAFNILLAHNPKYLDTYGTWGADLILSGHYHGGMVRIGKQGIISPYLRLFPKYSYGRYELQQSTAIVSGGLGEHTIPLRLFNPRELVCVKIIAHQ